MKKQRSKQNKKSTTNNFNLHNYQPFSQQKSGQKGETIKMFKLFLENNCGGDFYGLIDYYLNSTPEGTN
jgi:hypothetical protein